MALNAHLVLKGQKTGNVDGACTQKGREKTIEVIAISHEIISPRDPASGLPTGKRMHKPITLTVETSIEAPLMYNILTQNENITEWKLDLYQPNATGIEENFYRIELVNASIASAKFNMPNNKHADLMKFRPYIDWSFTYQKITWTILKPTNKTAQDDWNAPAG